jgi:phosphatidylserine decarboxylase
MSDEYKSMAVKLSLWAQARGIPGASPVWLTKLAHHFASKENPRLVSRFIRDYKINHTQATRCSPSNSIDQCALRYGTLSQFFTRQIRGIRIDDGPLVSPATCKAMVFDVFDDSKIWVKGRRWSAARLLRRDVRLQNYGVGIFRLRPQDYHRFHSPFHGVVNSVVSIHGGYLSVDPVVVRSKNVFTENNRVVVEVSTLYGTCYLVAVGAAGVGTVHIFPGVGDVILPGDELGAFDFEIGRAHV